MIPIRRFLRRYAALLFTALGIGLLYWAAEVWSAAMGGMENEPDFRTDRGAAALLLLECLAVGVVVALALAVIHSGLVGTRDRRHR